MAVWRNPIVTDNFGKVAHITCNPPSGTNISIGETNVTCEVVDGSGNKAGCSFQVDVKGTQHSKRFSIGIIIYHVNYFYLKH